MNAGNDKKRMCPICGKNFVIDLDKTYIRETCSDKCRVKKGHKTKAKNKNIGRDK